MTDRISIAVGDATAAQLNEFVSVVLGLETQRNETAASLKAKMASSGYDKDTVSVLPLINVTVAKVSAHTKEGEEVAGEEYVTIIIAKSEEKTGDQPVWASVNGRGLWIERGKPQRIRKCYAEVLDNATLTVYDQADGHAPLTERQVQRIPYRVINAA